MYNLVNFAAETTQESIWPDLPQRMLINAVKSPDQSRYSRSFLGELSGPGKIPTWKAPAPVDDFIVEVAGIQSFILSKVSPLTRISPGSCLCRISWPAPGINSPSTLGVPAGTALMPRYSTAVTLGPGLTLTLSPARTVSSIALAHVLSSGAAAPAAQCPFQGSLTAHRHSVQRNKL